MLTPTALLLLACAPSEEPIVGLAASSLSDVLPRVADAWAREGNPKITFSFDASSRLARQVEAGAPADFVVFADALTLDDLDKKGLVRGRRDLLGNTLVLVVPARAAWAPTTAAGLVGPELTHLAMAGESVPAGRYGRAALASAGVWTAVSPRVVDGESVRTALAWVSRGEAEAGIVYATDAAADPTVRIAFTFPVDSYPPIVYPGAALVGAAHTAEAEAFLTWCAGPAAQALFAEAGFLPPPPAR